MKTTCKNTRLKNAPYFNRRRLGAALPVYVAVLCCSAGMLLPQAFAVKDTNAVPVKSELNAAPHAKEISRKTLEGTLGGTSLRLFGDAAQFVDLQDTDSVEVRLGAPVESDHSDDRTATFRVTNEGGILRFRQLIDGKPSADYLDGDQSLDRIFMVPRAKDGHPLVNVGRLPADGGKGTVLAATVVHPELADVNPVLLEKGYYTNVQPDGDGGETRTSDGLLSNNHVRFGSRHEDNGSIRFYMRDNNTTNGTYLKVRQLRPEATRANTRRYRGRRIDHDQTER